MNATATDLVASVDSTPAGSSPTVYRRGAKLIARFMRAHPMPTVVSVIGAIAYSGAAVGATVVTGRVTDRFIGRDFGVVRPERAAVLWAVAAVVAMGLAKGLSVVVRRYFAAMLEARMQATLRRGVVDKYLSVPLSFHESRPTGELLAHADADVSGTTTLIKPLPFSIGLIALVVFSLISLVMVDWTFAAVALALFPMLTLLNRFYTHRVEGPAAQVQARLGDISSVAHESFDGALAVKTLGLESIEGERFAAAADRLRQERLTVGRLRATFEPILDVLPNLGILALFLVGAWRIDSGAVTPGQLVQASLLFSILTFPMRVFGFFLEELPRAVVSVERVDGVLDHDDAPGANNQSGLTVLPSGPLGMSIDDVSFSYGDDPVLDGVSFEVRAGETVALVGATGSGKSTLVMLAVRLAEPSCGRVRIGGVDIAALDAEELRSAVALVFQESFLFADTVRENVALAADGGDGDDPAGLEQAAEVAQVTRFLPRLPDGWSTVLGERGVTLSGGQRQRVALARALARQPRVLLLDDATSAVDPTVEAEILTGLRGLNATTLVVAHRLSTIALADRVVFLQGGRVAGIGAHQELLADPSYAALVQAYALEDAPSADGGFSGDRDRVGSPIRNDAS